MGAYKSKTHPLKSRRSVFKVGLVIFVVALLAVVYLWLLHRSDKPGDYSSVYSTIIGKQTPKKAHVRSTITGTKNYVSTDLMLSFNYPASWSVSESSSGVLTGRSPLESLKAPDGKLFKGQEVLTILSSAQSLSGFNYGNATAVLPSETLTYTKPSANQNPSSNISFLDYANSEPGGLSGVYITAYSYTVNQPIPEVDFNSVSPIIGLTFTSCVKTSCSTANISSSMWKSSSFSGPILSTLRSLVIN